MPDSVDALAGERRHACGTKLLFLHGSPATGKLTVAKALLQMVPGRLFDNHAAIDLARTLFEFGAPGFWELVHEVQNAALDTAAANAVPLVLSRSTTTRLRIRCGCDELSGGIRTTAPRHDEELLRRAQGETPPASGRAMTDCAPGHGCPEGGPGKEMALPPRAGLVS